MKIKLYQAFGLADALDMMKTENKPVTMQEAKERWQSHTSKVLSNEARKAMKAGISWGATGTCKPIVYLGASAPFEFAFVFERAYGHISARQI